MSQDTIDSATFAALQEAAGADFVADLVQTFLDEAPAMLADLTASLAVGDAERFRRVAHSLKSNSNTFGALGLGAMARELELSGLERARATPQALDALEREYALVAARLREMSRG